MGIRTKAIKASLLVMIGQGVVYGSSFIRNMILARLLTKADFGIAATFALVITLLEFSSKIGVSEVIIRDKDGDQRDFMATAHLVLFFVAMVSVLIIGGCAGPLSRLFGIPGARWAIMLLALIAFFRGFEHRDVQRFERHFRFGPSTMVDALPQVIITLAAWPVARWLPDYRCVLVLLLVKGLVSCIGTHLLAEEPYRWAIHRAHIRRILTFGWPLLVNGFLIFGMLQGDQFLVATSHNMTDLAPYAAAAALTAAPTFFFGRVFSSVMLPALAKVQDEAAAFARRYRQTLAMLTLFSMVFSVGMILGGEALMRLVYGAKYAGAGMLLAWLSAANAFRMLRVAPTLAALAKGDSQNQMISNIGRTASLAATAAVAFAHRPLWMVACTGLLGEALACWISIARLKRRDGVPLSTGLGAAGWILLAVIAAGTGILLGVYKLQPVLELVFAVLGACVGAAALTAATPELREEAAKLYALRHQALRQGRLIAFGESKTASL